MNMKRNVAVLVLAVGGFSAMSQAAIVTWNGASAVPTANWSDAGNWVGGLAPVAGDSLVFDGTVQVSNSNDFVAGTGFAGVSFATGAGTFVAAGNSINLAGDVINDRATAAGVSLNTPLALQQNVNVSSSVGTGLLNLNGAISGGFSVTKTGPGIIAVGSNLNTFNGGLNIGAGTFRTGVSGSSTTSLGTGIVSLSNAASLELRSTGATTFNNALDLGTGGGSIFVRSNHTLSPTAISGTGQLTLGPTGADNLVFTATDMKGWSGQINLTRNGRTNFGLRLATAFVQNSLLNASIDLGDATSIARQNGTNTLGTIVTDIGTLSSTATNSAVGASAAGSGYFVFSIGSKNQNSSFSGNMIDGSTRTALRKVGTATLTLSGAANTFSGPSSVNDGKLLVNGVLSAAALAITVNSPATLGGTGSIAGSVTSVGGTIAPGASVGTLTVSNSVSLDAATVLAYELDGSNTAVGGTTNDLLTGVSNLTLDGTLNVSEAVALSFSAATNGSTWRLINYTGVLTDNGLSLGAIPVLPAGGTLAISTATAGQVNLVLTVPEPTTLVAFLALAGVQGRRRIR